MKDITITAKQQKKELLFLLASFVLALGCNVYAIIYYNGSWSELYTEIFYVLTLTGAFYVASLLIRLLITGIKKLFKKNQ